MCASDELAFLDATAQAELIRRKQLTPLELVDAAIARIERLNPALNAVITPMFELARTAAHGRLPDGPFCGVPFLLKDLLVSYAGVRMASGSLFLNEFVPEHDSELVVRLKRAGLVIVGKTNTPEFGILPTTEPRVFGPTRNPWAPGRTTGGSSGGSAAAVAAGRPPGNSKSGLLRPNRRLVHLG
jgi:amidase